jgi:hypothetical protein
MPDEQLQLLAKAKNLQALKHLINIALEPAAVEVCDLNFRRNCLQISIQSIDIPDQKRVIPLLRRTIDQLQVHDLDALEIYGQRIGDELPHWMQQLKPEPPVASLDPVVIEPPTRLSLASARLEMLTRTRVANSAPTTSPGVQKTIESPICLAPPLQLTVSQVLKQYAEGNRNFQNLDLSEADLQGVNLTLADFQLAQFTWANLSNASLGHVNLTGAKLRHTNLTNANLQGANLQGSDFQGANLQGANLSWAELRGANLTGADLTNANLMNANLERVIMPDGTYLD